MHQVQIDVAVTLHINFALSSLFASAKAGSAVAVRLRVRVVVRPDLVGLSTRPLEAARNGEITL